MAGYASNDPELQRVMQERAAAIAQGWPALTAAQQDELQRVFAPFARRKRQSVADAPRGRAA